MSRSRDVVLLLTHSGDYFTIDRVAAALERQGAQPVRLNTDQFPMTVQLTAQISGSGLQFGIEQDGQAIAAEQVRSVWLRRLWQPQIPEALTPQFRSACIRESWAALDGFLDHFREAHWLDGLQQVRDAENKLRQLEIARFVGLQIPRTLVTNHPQQVRDFFAAVEGKMVTKLLTPLSYGMEGSGFFLYTSAVTATDLQEAESLRYCPMIFQEQIPKQRELRVVFVAGQLFVGSLDASRYAATTLDWRRTNSQECPWEPGELPTPVGDRLRSLMAGLGLGFGAIDLIQTPAGDYVFLEVNPTGEWGMLERDLGYPIAEAIADALLA
jgi:MvdC family ATP-grasp ribosomal peptide maturase